MIFTKLDFPEIKIVYIYAFLLIVSIFKRIPLPKNILQHITVWKLVTGLFMVTVTAKNGESKNFPYYHLSAYLPLRTVQTSFA